MPKKTTSQPTEQSTAESTLIGPNTTWEMTFPWKEIEPVYTKTLAKLAKRVKSAGFRPGKVPPHIAAPMIGAEQLAESTLQEIMPAKYQAALAENKKQPITRPSITITESPVEGEWKVEVAIAEKPSVEVKGFEKTVKEAKKTAEKAWADHLKEHDDDKTDKKEASTPAAADKPVEHAHEHTEQEKKDFLLQEIYKQLVSTYKVMIPELLLKEHTQEELEYIVRQLQSMKMTLEDYLKHRQMTFDQLSTDLAMQVFGRLQLEFVLEAIKATTSLTADEADLEKYFARIADPKAREAQRANPEYKNYVSSLVVREKLTEYLLAL